MTEISKPPFPWGKVSFILFALIPTISVITYYSFLASPVYVCKSSFAIMQPGAGVSTETDIMQTLQGQSGTQDIYILAEYIKSSELLEALEEEHQINEHYTNENIDYFSRLKQDAPWPEFHSYMMDKIVPDMNYEANIVTLSVLSYTPEKCQGVSKTIISKAEEFVNHLSDEIHKDFKSFANDQLGEAETNMVKSGENLTTYRNPNQAAQSVLGIISSLESEYSKTQVELAEKLRIHKPDTPVIESLKSRLNALQRQIKDERKKLASSSGTALSEELQEYEGLILQQEFSRSRYELALSLWEVVQTEALKKTKYLITIQKPLIPDIADWFYPTKKALTIAGTILLIYMVISTVYLAIKDHYEG